VTDATKRLMQRENVKKPLISSACPAVVRLIQVSYPNLIDNLVKFESPMETAAKLVRRRLAGKGDVADRDVGVFFITPCAAKATSVKAPYENKRSSVSGVISIKDIYMRMLAALDRTAVPGEDADSGEPLAGFEGVRWANSGGESVALGTDKFLAVDGINNVKDILEAVENDKLEDVEFIEALACSGGCIGGPLTVENVYVAKNRLNKHVNDAKAAAEKAQSAVRQEHPDEDLVWTSELEYKPVMKLDADFSVAMKKLGELEEINSRLPGLDCGACGAPSCRALAEDIVRGHANETDCIFKLREKVRDLASQMMELEARMPPVMDK
ncbi:MAG: ferredoxin, partial [Clostridiales bacterium]|nr:ferredoxin [Clostridiales bacterium]